MPPNRRRNLRKRLGGLSPSQIVWNWNLLLVAVSTAVSRELIASRRNVGVQRRRFNNWAVCLVPTKHAAHTSAAVFCHVQKLPTMVLSANALFFALSGRLAI